jgi:hypothetical protein
VTPKIGGDACPVQIAVTLGNVIVDAQRNAILNLTPPVNNPRLRIVEIMMQAAIVGVLLGS